MQLKSLATVKLQQVLNKGKKTKSPDIHQLKEKFQKTIANNPHAALLHLSFSAIIAGVMDGQSSIIELSKESLVKGLIHLSQMSLQPDFRLSKLQVQNYLDLVDLAYFTLKQWDCTKNRQWFKAASEIGLADLLPQMETAISVAAAIASGRVVFLSQQFSITYGDKNSKAGGLIISFIDSNGCWSDHKDEAVRLKVSTIRGAKRAISNWRGNSIIGVVPQSERQRLYEFLGLVPVPHELLNLVMLKGYATTKKGFAKN